jgi:hypothetical protein
MSTSFAEKIATFVASQTPSQKAAWMQERRWIAQARADLAAEVDAEIAAEEELKKRKKLCDTPHNTNWCRSCGNRRIVPVESRNTGWYVQDKHNELHRQR